MGEVSVLPGLQEVVENAYRVFARYRINGPLIVCNCPVCMTKANQKRLEVTPLREISASLLAQYTNSAHGMDDEIALQFRYFLPRYFELIADNDPPDSMGLSICLRRLGQVSWLADWPRAETDVIARYFDAFTAFAAQRLGTVEWPVGHRMEFDFRDVLTIAVTAGADIDRVLAAWDKASDPAAAVHMAAVRRDLLSEHDRTYLHSPFLEDHRGAADRIGAFLLRPEIVARIEAAFFAVGDPQLQQILSDGLAA